MTTETYVNSVKTGTSELIKSDPINRPTMLALFALLFTIMFGGILTQNEKSRKEASGTDLPVLSGRSAIEHLKRNGAYDSLAAAVNKTSYDANVEDSSVTARNEANHLQMSFSGSGLRLNSTVKGDKWASDWTLSSIGYGREQIPAAPGELRSSGNRVELGRSEIGLTEWFENSRVGVEHGFTVASRPQLSSNGQPLRLEISLGGDLTARADTNGQALTLVNKSGEESLRYENLKVWDANGKILAARMKAAGSTLSFDVDDAAAAYPVTIDPTFIQTSKITAADGLAEDQFGGAVAVSGNTAIVGSSAYGASTARSGAAYVYVKNAGTWALQQKLAAGDAKANDAFGWSVGIDGDTVVVGAFGDNVAGKTQQGSAYVFVRSGTTWTQQAKLTASDGAVADLFGWSVAVSANNIVVGANSDDTGVFANQGSAYVYSFDGVAWQQQQKLTAADGAAGDYFGDSVAMSGNTIIVGAPEDKTGANTQQGSAYVYVTDGFTWTQQQKLTAADGAIFDFFGFSVAISGDTVIVGTLQNVGASLQQGSAYVFVRIGSAWSQQQKLTASDGAADDSFGGNVAILGDRALIGAFGDTIGANVHQGSAYIFTRTGTTWTEQQKLTADDGGVEDALGSSVALTANAAIVGAMTDAIGANQSQGSAYVFSQTAKVSGRVTTPDGVTNLRNASVSIVDSAGVRLSVITNPFGLFSFNNVRTGETYLVSVNSKKYRYPSQQVQVVDVDVTNLLFVGLE